MSLRLGVPAGLARPSSPYFGEVPGHWTVSRFGLEMVVNGGLVDPQQAPWKDMVLVAPDHVESGTGRLTGRETAEEQGAESGKYLVRRGQIIYSKIRPALNKVTIAVEDCLCSADMYGLTSRKSDDHRYLMYYMLSQPFHSFATEMSSRVKMPKINRDELSAAPWIRPPIREQRMIAGFLDRETAKIDALIDKQNEMITLLQERLEAVIAEVAMPGDAPDMRLSHITRGIKDGTHATFVRVAETEGRPLLSAKNVTFRGLVAGDKETYISSEDQASIVSNGYPRQGDVLLVIIGATIGKSAVYRLEDPSAFQRSVAFLRPGPRIDPDFLCYQTRTQRFKEELALRTKTSAQPGVYLGDLAGIPVRRPPLASQREIVVRLDKETANVNAMIAKAEEFVALAKERRAALISAAVTGRIDVLEKVA